MPNEEDYRLKAYAYDLPPEKIAQFPALERGESKLLVLARDGIIKDIKFSHIASLLPENALLVANNARVLPCRLDGQRHGGGKAEFLLLTPLPVLLTNSRRNAYGWQEAEVECLLKPGAKIRKGDEIRLTENLFVQVVAKQEYGRHDVRLLWRGNLESIFAENGRMPLPPYIRRKAAKEDKEQYQTIYASRTGAVAAPTAGLHFTEEIRSSLLSLGMDWAEVTLHVGYGTFSPVRCEDIRAHRMHSEYVVLEEKDAKLIEAARREKRPIVAVGTTSLRALEGIFQKCGQIMAFQDWINIFIYPGQKIRVVNSLITNFHLPESTLLMLVSAFAGRQRILDVYKHALASGYRFFSYGDAMLIL